jgi:N-acetylglutamate synthase-like GNAT family acetyltransferase
MRPTNREASEFGDIWIREATASDAVDIASVHARAVLAVDRRYYSDQEIASWSGRVNPRGAQRLSELLRTSVFLVAETEGRIVGFAQLVPAQQEVRAVYVLPEAGGQGIGSALLARLEIAARGLGIETVELRASLNAVPFYAASGYERLEDTTHRLADGTELRCVRMRKSL